MTSNLKTPISSLDLLLKEPKPNIERIASLIYSDQRAKAIIKSHLSKKCVTFDDFDEVFQRTMFVFLKERKKNNGRIIDCIDGGAEGFYRLWWDVSENVVLDLLRESRRHEHFNDDDHEDLLIQKASLINDNNSVRFDEKIDTKLVFERFNDIFNKTSSSKIKSIVNDAMNTNTGKPRGRPKGSNKKLHSNMLPFMSGVVISAPEENVHDLMQLRSERLVLIRKTLGLSIAEYAEKLHLPEARLSSYIYGRVKKIPSDVIAAAEDIFQREQNVASMKATLDNMKMRDIIESWKACIHGTNDDLLILLNISPFTLARWQEEITRPPIRMLRRYNEIVAGYARYRKAKHSKRNLHSPK